MRAMMIQAITHLKAVDPDLARLIDTVGECTWQPHAQREPYEALVRAVAYQQLHPKAGDAILARMLDLFGGVFPNADTLVAADVAALRVCGFSARKIETIQGIARARLAGEVPDLATAQRMSDDALIAQLIKLKGIGRWTVEMMLIFTLGREDILPVDDFGVCDGYRRLKGLITVPKPKEMYQIGLAWQPYRTYAAWYLWRVPKLGSAL